LVNDDSAKGIGLDSIPLRVSSDKANRRLQPIPIEGAPTHHSVKSARRDPPKTAPQRAQFVVVRPVHRPNWGAGRWDGL